MLIQAMVAMEQEQIRLDIIVFAAAGTCIGTRSNAMSTHRGLIPESHTRTSRRSAKDRQRRTSFQMDLKDLEISQDLGTRASQDHPKRALVPAPLNQGICKIFTQGPLRQDLTRIGTRSSDKDL